MKDQFFFSLGENYSDLNGVVKSLIIEDKKIIMKLKSDKKYSTITWMPSEKYKKTSITYNGPWIKGINNKIGALSFNRRDIN